MPDNDFLARSFRYLQENVRRSGPAAAASYTLIGAIILLGGFGYAIDEWRGTSPWFLLGSLVGHDGPADGRDRDLAPDCAGVRGEPGASDVCDDRRLCG